MAFHNVHDGTPEWHAIRRQNVGASEVAALFGEQPDFAQSAYTLHMVKSGRIPTPPVDDGPGSRVWFGKYLEPTIARMAAAMWGWWTDKGTYCTDDTTPGMAASLDYIVREPGPDEIAKGYTGPGALELKNADWLAHRKSWDGGDPPMHILLQLQQQLACSGYTWGCIVCLVGGNQLVKYHYVPRPRIIDAIRERVTQFWADVRAGKAPPVDGTDSTAAALKVLYPSLGDDEPLDLMTHNEASEAAAQFMIAQADKASADARYIEARNRLEGILQGRRRAVCQGFSINVAVTPDNPGRVAMPGEIIGRRAGSRRFTVREVQN